VSQLTTNTEFGRILMFATTEKNNE